MIKSITLKATSGPYVGKEIKIEQGQPLRVGRAPKSGVPTGDPYMSGEHFTLECTSQTCRIRDLNSRHGTFLNRERVSEALLHDGDQIYAGQTTLVVHIEEAGPIVDSSGSKRTTEAKQTEPKQTGTASIPTAAAAPRPPSPPNQGPAVSTSSLPSSANSGKQVPLPPSPPIERKQTPSRPAEAAISPVQQAIATPKNAAARALELATAATPEGRLLSILIEQREPLFALLDAAREPTVPELLRVSGEEYQSLYAGEELVESAPYLVYLPQSSKLLERLVREGWGRGWIVYLTCGLSLRNIREYFRQSLMIKLPDGREFFSRFYDPRFFRGFLRGCTQAEADRFFGPITTYSMEAENSEILLQFTKSTAGVLMKERLLLIPGT